MIPIKFSLSEIYNSYLSWVSKNPQTASDFETVAKWISYFIAGRINNSHAVSELVYCLSNLLILLNDQIIRKTRKIENPTSGDELKLWLTIVEYSEVFCELSAEKLWGRRGKWLIIVIVQVFKCITRLILVYQHKEGTVQNPPIQVLNRRALTKDANKNEVGKGFSEPHFENASFTLKRSGRVVRKVESSPPIYARSWRPLKNVLVPCKSDEIQQEESLEGKVLLAETMYIVKPLVHLTSMGLFGDKAWKPWLISLAMDLASLKLYKSAQSSEIRKFTSKRELEVSRRTVALILYLIRSPFYEKQSKDKIHALVTALSNNVPLARIVCNAFLQYLPFWQSSYFYIWST